MLRVADILDPIEGQSPEFFSSLEDNDNFSLFNDNSGTYAYVSLSCRHAIRQQGAE